MHNKGFSDKNINTIHPVKVAFLEKYVLLRVNYYARNLTVKVMMWSENSFVITGGISCLACFN